MQLVGQAERARQALLGCRRLAAVPGGAGRVERRHELVGEQLLRGVEDLPGGGDRGGVVPGLQPRGDQREQVDPAVAGAEGQRAGSNSSNWAASAITSSGCPSCQASQA